MDGFARYREGIERLTGLADVDEVLQGLARLLKKMFSSRWTVAYLLDREQRQFAPGRSSGLYQERGRPTVRRRAQPLGGRVDGKHAETQVFHAVVAEFAAITRRVLIIIPQMMR